MREKAMMDGIAENTAQPGSKAGGKYMREAACCFIGTVLGNLFCEFLSFLFP